MMISLLVLLAPLALVVALFRLRGGEDVTVVDPAPAIAQAVGAGLFVVTPPAGLPQGWRCVSAAFRRSAATGVLRVGYLTPSNGGLQLVESNEAVNPLLARELGDRVRPLGTVTVAGRSWQSYQVRAGERALVLVDSGRTVIVIGAASPPELEVLAAVVV